MSELSRDSALVGVLVVACDEIQPHPLLVVRASTHEQRLGLNEEDGP